MGREGKKMGREGEGEGEGKKMGWEEKGREGEENGKGNKYTFFFFCLFCFFSRKVQRSSNKQKPCLLIQMEKRTNENMSQA